MRGRKRFSLSVISTGGPAQPGWNGEISSGAKGEPGRGPDPSTALRSAQDDKGLGAGGFTLIELLVVISIIALLMAILMPTLQRVKKQARAVVCQSNLKQWGTLMAMQVNENDGRFPEAPSRDDPDYREGWWGWGYGGWGWGGTWGSRDPEKYHETEDIRCCPMATKPANPTGSGSVVGGTFLAWGRLWPEGAAPEPWDRYAPYGSYGFNSAVGHHWYYDDSYWQERVWRTADVRGRDRIPVYFDSAWPWSWWSWRDAEYMDPPECDAIPTALEPSTRHSPCINRHDGGINALFLDWAVRKVGLKELWPLKWHRQYNTSGPWTNAGGAEPGDWPQWMRSFKDY